MYILRTWLGEERSQKIEDFHQRIRQTSPEDIPESVEEFAYQAASKFLKDPRTPEKFFGVGQGCGALISGFLFQYASPLKYLGISAGIARVIQSYLGLTFK